MYQIIFSKSAVSFLKKLEKDKQKRIIGSLERIRIKPENYIKKLVGMEGYRFRVGEYRIILDLNKNELQILVIKVGHRKNIYN